MRQQQAYLQDLNVVVEGERDQLRGMVNKLQKEVDGLRRVEEEAASYKGKAMQRAQALEKATAAITKAECEIRRLKANREKPKARVEGGKSEGEEETTASTATIYRRAEGLKDSILGVVGKSRGTFGCVWEVVMRCRRSTWKRCRRRLPVTGGIGASIGCSKVPIIAWGRKRRWCRAWRG